jgi:hypothetical protein
MVFTEVPPSSTILASFHLEKSQESINITVKLQAKKGFNPHCLFCIHIHGVLSSQRCPMVVLVCFTEPKFRLEVDQD